MALQLSTAAGILLCTVGPDGMRQVDGPAVLPAALLDVVRHAAAMGPRSRESLNLLIAAVPRTLGLTGCLLATWQGEDTATDPVSQPWWAWPSSGPMRPPGPPAR